MKRFLYSILLTFFSVSLSIANGQLNKAEKLYEANYFADAVKYYEKGLKKEPKNIQAIEHLADAYRQLKQYTLAEKWYNKAITLNTKNPQTYYYYGQILKTQNRISEAKNQFQKFIDLSGSNTTAVLLGKLLLQSCEEAQKLNTEEPYFKIGLVNGVNSEFAEFSPFLLNNQLVFTAERTPDLLEGKQFSVNNKPYLSIYKAKSKTNNKTEFNKISLFNKRLYSEFHDGPITFNKEGNLAFFSRVDKSTPNKSGVVTAKIYFSQKHKKKWSKPQPFHYNSKEYSITHPALSPDGKYLFFASDMPGGQGGMDIYMCKNENGQWSKPINLGSDVNTPGNEVFPYFYNGILYFSSDALPGMGGLDIFYVKESNNWKEPQNLKNPVNSSYDDFGIFMYDDKHGYFSSNREGGIGSDDIYYFERIRDDEEMKPKTKILGLFEYKNLPADGVTLQLIDEEDNFIAETITDKNGKFVFKNLSPDKNYMILLKENDFDDDYKIYLLNENGEKVMRLNRFAEGKHKFKALPFDEYNNMTLIEEEDAEVLFTIGLSGQIYKLLPGDVSAGMEIMVVDDEGNIIMKTFTDENGKFKFRKLKPDENYLLMINEEDADFKIVMFDDQGKLLGEAQRFKNNVFKYRRLSPDENSITLINEEDEVIKISQNDHFIVSNILYEYRSAELNDKAKKELDKLVLIMMKNPKIVIELSSHTDSKGGESYNLKLSEKRAKIAKEYLISKGIDSNRIIGKGYGESKPIAPNTNPDGTDNPEGRAKNRRTEIRIVEW
jgi:outer membrane protein OmpA-like peptidoglycan-associated protein/tetratricopeptide (TPR) repeat protein